MLKPLKPKLHVINYRMVLNNHNKHCYMEISKHILLFLMLCFCIKLHAFTPVTLDQHHLIPLADQTFYPALRNKIQQAKQSIWVSMYLFKISKSNSNKATQIANELIEAKKRGIKVRVFLEKSDYSKNINKYNRYTAKYLKKHGINSLFDSESNTSHQKMIIIDDQWTFMGSHNLTHSALTKNHEFSILIDNEKFARQSKEYILSSSKP